MAEHASVYGADTRDPAKREAAADELPTKVDGDRRFAAAHFAKDDSLGVSHRDNMQVVRPTLHAKQLTNRAGARARRHAATAQRV